MPINSNYSIYIILFTWHRVFIRNSRWQWTNPLWMRLVWFESMICPQLIIDEWKTFIGIFGNYDVISMTLLSITVTYSTELIQSLWMFWTFNDHTFHSWCYRNSFTTWWKFWIFRNRLTREKKFPSQLLRYEFIGNSSQWIHFFSETPTLRTSEYLMSKSMSMTTGNKLLFAFNALLYVPTSWTKRMEHNLNINILWFTFLSEKQRLHSFFCCLIRFSFQVNEWLSSLWIETYSKLFHTKVIHSRYQLWH